METRHRVITGDARDIALADDSVELVVTSPPYPMIEMWDDIFASLDPAIADALERATDHDAVAAIDGELAALTGESPEGAVAAERARELLDRR